MLYSFCSVVVFEFVIVLLEGLAQISHAKAQSAAAFKRFSCVFAPGECVVREIPVVAVVVGVRTLSRSHGDRLKALSFLIQRM
jgi:hypothetical protein